MRLQLLLYYLISYLMNRSRIMRTNQFVLMLRSWGVCFTYGIWFGLEAFACMGHVYKDE